MTVMRAQSVGARKWWALAGLSLGVLAVGLDATVLSVALPTLAVSLHASATDLQWFISSYTLALAVALLPGGLLGDRFGRKKVMIIALSVFGLGIAGVCVRAERGCVHRRADGARAGRGGHDPAGAVGARGDVHRRGADQGGRRLGGGQLHRPADRPDPRRLAADQLLVGLGVPAERPGGGDRPGRGHGAGAGIPRRPPARPGPGGNRRVVRRSGRADLRVHRGRAVRLVIAHGDLRDGWRRWRSWRPSPRGNCTSPGAPAGSRSWISGCSGRPGSPGEPSCRRSASSRCSACCSRRRSSSRRSWAWTRWAAASGCCR